MQAPEPPPCAAPPTVAEHLALLLSSGRFSDVQFELDGGLRVAAHRCVLAARSAYFDRMFCSGFREACDPVIPLPGTPAAAFQLVLGFVYSDAADFDSATSARCAQTGRRAWNAPLARGLAPAPRASLCPHVLRCCAGLGWAGLGWAVQPLLGLAACAGPACALGRRRRLHPRVRPCPSGASLGRGGRIGRGRRARQPVDRQLPQRSPRSEALAAARWMHATCYAH